MKIDKKFIKDAHTFLRAMIKIDNLPPIGHWIWLEPNKVRLYRFDDWAYALALCLWLFEWALWSYG